MRLVVLVVVVLPLVLMCGCDLGGSSSDSDNTVTITSGTMSVAAGTGQGASSFSIGQPGRVDVTVTWTGGPSELTVYVNAAGGSTAGSVGGSPVVATMIVSQAILDISNTLTVGVLNYDTTDANVAYTVVFTPDE